MSLAPFASLLRPFVLLALLGSLERPSDAQCGTTVQGAVSGTWTLAGSPYCVVADVVATNLTIEAGVVVRCDAATRVRVEGSLNALGTAVDEIVFEASDGAASWRGLELFTPGGALLSHVRVRDASESAIRALRGATTLVACTLEENASDRGGGLFASLPLADLALTDCTLRNNTAVFGGGGLDATIAEGKLTLTRCRFVDNRVNVEPVPVSVAVGGAVSAFAAEGVDVFDSSFERNEVVAYCDECFCFAIAEGGGMHVTGCPLTIVRSVFRENVTHAYDACCLCSGEYAECSGGGLFFDGTSNYSLTAIGCVFVGNVCRPEANGISGQGGGFLARYAFLDVQNCTIARNRLDSNWGIGTGNGAGLQSGPGSSGRIASCIVFRNLSMISGGSGLIPSVAVDYTMNPYNAPGIGNINADPLFRGSGTSVCDVEILPESPCIDAGDPSAASNDVAFPPSQGAARNDMGFTGGPSGEGWLPNRATGLELELDPATRPCPTRPPTVTFRMRGGELGRPVGVFLEALNGVPLPGNPARIGPFLLLCTTGEAELSLATPKNLCNLPPLTFRAYTLDSTGTIVGSNAVTW